MADKTELYRLVFSTDGGKKILTDLASQCHFFETTMADNDRLSAMMEGERNIFLYILGQLDIDASEISNYLCKTNDPELPDTTDE